MPYSDLPTLQTISDHIRLVKKEELTLIQVEHEKAQATISLFGGHVMSFIPKGEQELIWMSKASKLDAKTPIRGGIPICWPWFGPMADPSHGFARISNWTLKDHSDSKDGVKLTLTLSSNTETLAIWPHQFELELTIEINQQLKTSLKITNTDDKAWAFSGALHTYLNIADINHTSVQGMGDTYLDKKQQGKECQGADELIFNGGVDRIYTQAEPTVEIFDQDNQRQISVHNQGNNCAVIWNPWEGAKNMGDMRDYGYLTMLCVESTWFAPSFEQSKSLAPNESHLLTTQINTKQISTK